MVFKVPISLSVFERDVSQASEVLFSQGLQCARVVKTWMWNKLMRS